MDVEFEIDWEFADTGFATTGEQIVWEQKKMPGGNSSDSKLPKTPRKGENEKSHPGRRSGK